MGARKGSRLVCVALMIANEGHKARRREREVVPLLRQAGRGKLMGNRAPNTQPQRGWVRSIKGLRAWLASFFRIPTPAKGQSGAGERGAHTAPDLV
jgi:hypothetical protein